jgi:Concanavalin A-like lectin/glucanases superfamily
VQYDIAGTLGNGSWGYIVGTHDKDAGANSQSLYLNGARVAQMRDTLPIDLNAAALGIGRHVSGIADPFNGHIIEFRSSHVQRSDGWIERSRPPGTTRATPVRSPWQEPKSRKAVVASRHR